MLFAKIFMIYKEFYCFEDLCRGIEIS